MEREIFKNSYHALLCYKSFERASLPALHVGVLEDRPGPAHSLHSRADGVLKSVIIDLDLARLQVFLLADHCRASGLSDDNCFEDLARLPLWGNGRCSRTSYLPSKFARGLMSY